MNVCFIGKHIYPENIFSNEQDLKTWRSLSAYFDKVFVIAESPDLFFHFNKENNIRIYLVPRLGYIGFVLISVVLGLYIKSLYRVDVFDASEVIGGGVAATTLRFLTGTLSVVEIQGEIFRKPERKQNFSAQGRSVFGGKNWLLKKIGRFVMKRAARIRVISNAIFGQVKEQGIPAEKIHLVSLRVDLNLFKPPVSISEIDTNGDKMGITIGYVGRLMAGKGLEDLFEAIKILKDYNMRFKSWSLIIHGVGPMEKKLKEVARKLGINDKIEWQGFVPYGKVPEALSRIDIFVYPSWHEGFGRSIMEALAMEKAVVATRVGGIPDLIKDGDDGFLIEPHSPEKLAQKIRTFMEDEDLRLKFGKAGREWVSQNFEWNQGIKKFANLFLELKQ